ncbi:outer membrane protein assembly factor BamE [Ferrimonas balearica]|uniref:outer membrane protein assembly factor BamE n=1 Tax=Ferrimonas balearica TaxID=44012 RepID=UPI001C56C28A|nr:outer membrane protein assembly factor BamE [Ferrimonas balearica]MBY6017384.1 outer membrane protein assembly factor BamE [Halomonas denitrificans]MBW3140123.1 outer membrane protein assembly factor BamE [Ferrimonas balearica]MBW3165145.1 outer membrane protein assembly factor BamE [Ferrimonas balearica]MBY6093650.1 outer membrane protein assembly factor BamE [Ferrimonas balearica]MBY6106769.1 outer membrane protein assembly factor BamE [Ferrimonas balearica]
MKPLMMGALAVLLLAGCSKLTQENYDKIEMGMSKTEVEAILGGADKCEQAMGTESCVWGNDDKQIKVGFAGDNAVLFTSKGLK